MNTPISSKKGKELINFYKQMVREGYERTDQTKVDNAFSDFELRAYRPDIRSIFNEHAISMEKMHISQSVTLYGGKVWLTA